jgi:hypothetical protein
LPVASKAGLTALTASLDQPVLTALMALPGRPVLMALMALPGLRDPPVLTAQTAQMVQTVPTPHNALPLTRPLTSPLTAAITSRCLALAILV